MREVRSTGQPPLVRIEPAQVEVLQVLQVPRERLAASSAPVGTRACKFTWSASTVPPVSEAGKHPRPAEFFFWNARVSKVGSKLPQSAWL